jgi:hypothetical protein
VLSIFAAAAAIFPRIREIVFATARQRIVVTAARR